MHDTTKICKEVSSQVVCASVVSVGQPDDYRLNGNDHTLLESDECSEPFASASRRNAAVTAIVCAGLARLRDAFWYSAFNKAAIARTGGRVIYAGVRLTQPDDDPYVGTDHFPTLPRNEAHASPGRAGAPPPAAPCDVPPVLIAPTHDPDQPLPSLILNTTAPPSHELSSIGDPALHHRHVPLAFKLTPTHPPTHSPTYPSPTRPSTQPLQQRGSSRERRTSRRADSAPDGSRGTYVPRPIGLPTTIRTNKVNSHTCHVERLPHAS